MYIHGVFFEHMIHCLKNQKVIHEQPEETQKHWQKVIDDCVAEAERQLQQAVASAGGQRLDGTPAAPVHNFSGSEVGQYRVDPTKSSFV